MNSPLHSHHKDFGPVGIYRVFNADGDLLYIGQSSSILGRIDNHKQCKDWRTEISFVEVEWFKTRVEAKTAERDAILAERPRYNVDMLAGEKEPQPAGRPFTTKEKYRELAEAGLTQSETADALGVSREAVRQASVKYGLEFKCGKTSPERDAIIRECSERGMTRKQAAKAAGVSVHYLASRGRKLGLDFAEATFRDDQRAATFRKYQSLANEGLTGKEAADRLGVSRTVVYQQAKKYGVTFADGRAKRWAK